MVPSWSLTLARTGGVGANPPCGFSQIAKKRRRYAPPGFGVPYGANLAQLLVKKIDQVRSGHGARTQIDSGDTGLSFRYLTILLASILIKIIATFCENNSILRKFDLFHPLWPQIWTDQKNDLSIFCRNWRCLSNAVCCLSLSLLVSEFSGGGYRPRPCAGGRSPPAWMLEFSWNFLRTLLESLMNKASRKPLRHSPPPPPQITVLLPMSSWYRTSKWPHRHGVENHANALKCTELRLNAD